MLIFTFDSANVAMRAKSLSGDLQGVRFIPLPPEIDAGCGLCLKCEQYAAKAVREILDREEVSYREVELDIS